METIKDIVREMRERADAIQIHGTVLGVKRTVKEFADRIEAACERETAPRNIDAFDTMRDALRAYDDEMPDGCSASHWVIRFDDWGLDGFLNWLKSTDEGGVK